MSMKNSEVVVVARNFMKKICVENIQIYVSGYHQNGICMEGWDIWELKKKTVSKETFSSWGCTSPVEQGSWSFEQLQRSFGSPCGSSSGCSTEWTVKDYL